MTSQWKEWGPALAQTPPAAIKSRSRASMRRRGCIRAPMRSRTSGSQRQNCRQLVRTATRRQASLAEPSPRALPQTGWRPPRTYLATLTESVSRSLCTWGPTSVCFAEIKLWTTRQVDATLPHIRPTWLIETSSRPRWFRLPARVCQLGVRLPLPLSQPLLQSKHRSSWVSFHVSRAHKVPLATAFIRRLQRSLLQSDQAASSSKKNLLKVLPATLSFSQPHQSASLPSWRGFASFSAE